MVLSHFSSRTVFFIDLNKLPDSDARYRALRSYILPISASAFMMATICWECIREGLQNPVSRMLVQPYYGWLETYLHASNPLARSLQTISHFTCNVNFPEISSARQTRHEAAACLHPKNAHGQHSA